MIPNLEKPITNFDINKKIYSKLNAIPIDVCDKIILYGKENVKQGINKYSHSFQVKFHTCLLPLNHEVHSLLANVWDEAIEYFKFDISFVEPYELKRYTDTDFFGKHVDSYYSLQVDIDRKLTMVVQLSDTNEYTGDLKIFNNKVHRNKGSVTVFPSFFTHEVTKTTGVRWSLIGWAWGPYWK